MKIELFLLIQNLHLPEDINITLVHPDGNVNYNFTNADSISGRYLLDTFLQLTKKSEFISKREEKIIKEFKEKLIPDFEKHNPLVLIKIIPDSQFPDNEIIDKIPDVIKVKLNEILLSIGLLYSSSIKPLFLVLVKKNDSGILIDITYRKLSVDLYKKIFAERNIKSLMRTYLNRLISNQRGESGEWLKIALELYKLTIDWDKQKLRVMLWWAILEMLASRKKNGSNKEKVTGYVKETLLEYEKEKIEESWLMRCSLSHQGKFKKDKDYNKGSQDMRELVESLLYKELDNIPT